VASGGAGLARRWTARVAALQELSWPDRWLLLHAWLAVFVVSGALRVGSFQRVHSILRRCTRSGNRRVKEHRAPERVREVARLVSLAARHTLLPNTCLHRSLALWWLLERRGFASRLEFGARKRNGAFEAHAWVEHDGVVVSDDQSENFARLPWTSLKNDV
jgi:hypothetical protein